MSSQMFQEVSRSSLWQIAREAKVYINSLFNKCQAPSRQNQSQPYSQHRLHEKTSHSNTVSCINVTSTSHSPLSPAVISTEYDSIQETDLRYDSLWEIQLALGEIPGMFEGNILQPCQPREQTPKKSTNNDQNQIQLSFQKYTFPGSSSLTFLSGTLNKDEDENSYDQVNSQINEWSYDHSSQLYLSNPLYQQDKTDIRHDRKDSGIFVHDEDGVFSQISPSSKIVNADNDFEISEWSSTEIDDCEFDYGNMTIESRVLAFRSSENFPQMEIGSLTLPLSSFPQTLFSSYPPL